ncbi:MAG: ABC transporter ATP-binding protein [Gemmatimonadaceae bacterium]|nr:ABC transporter ATP-binding protein [Chitinophagaceae bacterium]
MSQNMIEVRNLSKLYKLGVIGTGTLSHDLNGWWKRKKSEDENDGDEDLWSLKDVSFDVGQGDIFGVIGRNGAGKSTLLKLLSKITKPTRGTIKLNGRIASLLEVGTGFHPDLTGRENIFLNGAILGMKKIEIKNKFDEIVDFSGVERFIDTPVKRYSSGMYVRLAFAVAAHLEPEILIIDEVLAVGDAEFQQKCMGKIKDVSLNRGRTVLCVSHNTVVIKQLCNKLLFLEKGIQKAVGTVDEVIGKYQEKEKDTDLGRRGNVPSDGVGYFVDWKLKGHEGSDQHTSLPRKKTEFIFSFTNTQLLAHCELRFLLFNEAVMVLNASSMDNGGVNFSLLPGHHQFGFHADLPISHGQYGIELALISSGTVIDIWRPTTKLTILNNFEVQMDGALLNIPFKFYIQQKSRQEPLHSEALFK